MDCRKTHRVLLEYPQNFRIPRSKSFRPPKKNSINFFRKYLKYRLIAGVPCSETRKISRTAENAPDSSRYRIGDIVGSNQRRLWPKYAMNLGEKKLIKFLKRSKIDLEQKSQRNRYAWMVFTYLEMEISEGLLTT